MPINPTNPAPLPGAPATRAPFATIPMPGATKQKGPVKPWRIKGRNFLLRPMLGMIGINIPAYNEEGYLDDQKLMEFVETLPDEVRIPLNQMVDSIADQMPDITGPLPELTFDELQKFLPEGMLPTPEDLSRMIPSLAQTDFAPIAQEAERRFQQETVPGILNQLTGLGQSGRSSAFQGALGRAGSDLQSKLAAMESGHNLERGKLQLGQGELGGRLYEAASKRATLLGGLQGDQSRLGLSRAQSLGQLQLGQQGNVLGQKGQLLNTLSGQMNRPTTSYQPGSPANPWAQFGQDVTMPLAKAGLKYGLGI